MERLLITVGVGEAPFIFALLFPSPFLLLGMDNLAAWDDESGRLSELEGNRGHLYSLFPTPDAFDTHRSGEEVGVFG